MSNTKKNACILCTLSLFFLFNCQKNKPVIDFEFGGSFYGEYYYERLEPWHVVPDLRYYDQVVDILVEDDTLKFLGYTFEITSNTQTLFINHFDTLRFSDNHDSISLYSFNTRLNSVTTFEGERNGTGVYQNKPTGLFLDTTIYSFFISKKETPVTYPGVAVDTQYTADLLVEIKHNYDRISVTIENEIHDVTFKSTYGSRTTGNFDRVTKNISWKGDSLLVESVEYLTNGPFSGVDSVHYIYQGVKK